MEIGQTVIWQGEEAVVTDIDNNLLLIEFGDGWDMWIEKEDLQF